MYQNSITRILTEDECKIAQSIIASNNDVCNDDERRLVNLYIAKTYAMCGKVTAFNFERYGDELFYGCGNNTPSIYNYRHTSLTVMCRRVESWNGKHKILFREHALNFLLAIVIMDYKTLIAEYSSQFIKKQRSLVAHFNRQQYITTMYRRGGYVDIIFRLIDLISDTKLKYKLLDRLILRYGTYLPKAHKMCEQLGYKVPYYYYDVITLINYPMLLSTCHRKCRLPLPSYGSMRGHHGSYLHDIAIINWVMTTYEVKDSLDQIANLINWLLGHN